MYIVYPSASDTTQAAYSIQDGNGYRRQQHNARKGYNQNAIFRCVMTPEDTKKLLMKKIISHIFISLVPFNSLIRTDQDSARIQRVFNAFKQLVCKDYNSNKSEYLDSNWQSSLDKTFNNKLGDTLNTSKVSSHVEDVSVSTTHLGIINLCDLEF